MGKLCPCFKIYTCEIRLSANTLSKIKICISIGEFSFFAPMGMQNIISLFDGSACSS